MSNLRCYPRAHSFVRACTIAATLSFAVASAPALAIKPFSADYQASFMGLQGSGKVILESQGGDKWKYSLAIGSSGVQLNQTTVFEDKAGAWRPLSGSDSARVLIKSSSTTSTYDWSKGVATWSGDVKPERAGPVTLQAGDVDALLLNLVLARDISAGKPLNYRLVEDGRAKPLSYTVTGTEAITIDGQSRQATKATQTDGNRQITVWVVDGVPAPARILQQKNGKDDIDLRIQSVN
ncbi:MAG: DUF3108 domain-containing protein [Luteimonas sp.]